jgi:hypothetical protein
MSYTGNIKHFLLSHSVTTCLGAVAVCSNEGTAHIVHVFSDAVMGKINGHAQTLPSEIKGFMKLILPNTSNSESFLGKLKGFSRN